VLREYLAPVRKELRIIVRAFAMRLQPAHKKTCMPSTFCPGTPGASADICAFS
jgi:hypothetical protein